MWWRSASFILDRQQNDDGLREEESLPPPGATSKPNPNISAYYETRAAHHGVVTSDWLAQAQAAIQEPTELEVNDKIKQQHPFSVIDEFNNWRKQPHLAEAVAAIRALAAVIRSSEATTMMELEIDLHKASDSLKSWDTTSISLTAGCDLFMRYVTRTAALEYEDFNSAKSRLIERADKFGEISYKARKIIAMLSQDFIFDGCTILVHGFSRVVFEVLKLAAQNKKLFRVFCTEGRPDRTGLRLSNELAKLDVPPLFCPGIDTPSEGLVRWKLRLEYFAYETLQDLRIAKLFEIIVDYPESSPAIEDLKLCLEYTGQHSKLVESFISALRYRLLTAGASTNDILHQYVSTIKALRTIDPAGVFLEAVGEPIRDYLRGRRDTIKCIVTMLTDGTGGNSSASGNPGDSLLEELNRDEEIQENVGVDDDFNTDDREAWINASRWQPDPVEADPLKGSRNQRKVDILGMIVGIIGSKDQLVHEYRTMLAEKLLNKSDYDIDSEIRTLELLKIHFGESSLQKCEIMLNDLIGSKRINSNIKATISQPSQTNVEVEENAISMDKISATIISSNFWPPIQDEPLNLPEPVDKLLSDYAKRFNEIKTPRKLQWKKSLGTVKLELQLKDRVLQFTVAPVHASIIVKFQDQTSWTSKNLAAAVGIPVDALNRRMSFWISKGVIAESSGGDSSDHVFTIMESMVETKKGDSSGSTQELLGGGDEEEDRAVATIENQLRKEMTIYEKFIMGMLTNFGSMALDRIHNTLKMFCIADPPYDKSLQQLQSFLSGLVSEEKLELRDGMYTLKK